MIHPLDGVNLKVERARKHFQDLDQMVKSFLKANPYQITREFDVSLGENVFRVVESPKEGYPVSVAKRKRDFGQGDGEE